MKKALITGASAVAASDFAAGFLPATFDFNGFPVRRWGSAVAGAYAAEKFQGGASLGKAVISGVVALLSANLKSNYLPSLVFQAGPLEIGRLVAGGLGIVAASKLGIEKVG